LGNWNTAFAKGRGADYLTARLSPKESSLTEKHDEAAAELLIKEVDEDLRHEQMATLWKKHGNLVVGAAVALVLSVAGWQGWHSWEAKQRQGSSLRYAEAAQLIDQGKRDEAAEVLSKLSADGTKGYRVLSELKRADLRQQAGDAAGAGAIYQRLAADSSVDRVYRDLAAIKAAYLSLDTAAPAEVEKAVEPLAAESSPWRHSAREIQALAAVKRGDATRAADLFRKIAEDAAAPQGLRTRAAEMLASTGPRTKG
jgi:hypothetical protein